MDWLRAAGFTIQADLVIGTDEDVPGAVIFASSATWSPPAGPDRWCDPASGSSYDEELWDRCVL